VGSPTAVRRAPGRRLRDLVLRHRRVRRLLPATLAGLPRHDRGRHDRDAARHAGGGAVLGALRDRLDPGRRTPARAQRMGAHRAAAVRLHHRVELAAADLRRPVPQPVPGCCRPGERRERPVARTAGHGGRLRGRLPRSPSGHGRPRAGLHAPVPRRGGRRRVADRRTPRPEGWRAGGRGAAVRLEQEARLPARCRDRHGQPPGLVALHRLHDARRRTSAPPSCRPCSGWVFPCRS
jgi:hypothetical protein